MKTLKSAILGIALTAAAGQASAAGLLFDQNWGFNYLGTGVGGAYTPVDEMTYQGISFTNSTGISSGSTFQDVGRFGATGFSNDGSPIAAADTGLGVNYAISATYLDWTGTYGATTLGNTAFSFDAGGTLNLFLGTGASLGNNSFATAGDGANIMTLSILSGGGNINFGNAAGLDGNVDILFQITNAAAGYWFLDTDGNGTADTDLAALLATGKFFGVGLTNSNNAITTPSLAVKTDFISTTTLGGATGAGDIYTLNNGSASIGVSTIPEPGTIALLGLGLLGFGAAGRRRA